MELVDIPVGDIQVINRLRKTDASKIQELATSISDIDLLHPIAVASKDNHFVLLSGCLLYTSPSPRDGLLSRMPSSA